jgi:hypothetical protein
VFFLTRYKIYRNKFAREVLTSGGFRNNDRGGSGAVFDFTNPTMVTTNKHVGVDGMIAKHYQSIGLNLADVHFRR